MKEHYMRLDSRPFADIACGQKTYELRLFDEKRRALSVGDIIVFTNNSDGAELRVRIAELLRFSSFDELYSVLPLCKCGYTEEELSTATPCDMEKYYSRDLQRRYGVLAIEIEVV